MNYDNGKMNNNLNIYNRELLFKETQPRRQAFNQWQSYKWAISHVGQVHWVLHVVISEKQFLLLPLPQILTRTNIYSSNETQ